MAAHRAGVEPLTTPKSFARSNRFLQAMTSPSRNSPRNWPARTICNSNGGRPRNPPMMLSLLRNRPNARRNCAASSCLPWMQTRLLRFRVCITHSSVETNCRFPSATRSHDARLTTRYVMNRTFQFPKLQRPIRVVPKNDTRVRARSKRVSIVSQSHLLSAVLFAPSCVLMPLIIWRGKLSAFQTHGCDEISYASSL